MQAKLYANGEGKIRYLKYIVPDLYSSGIMQLYPGFSCLPARVEMNSSSLSFFLSQEDQKLDTSTDR